MESAILSIQVEKKNLAPDIQSNSKRKYKTRFFASSDP